MKKYIVLILLILSYIDCNSNIYKKYDVRSGMSGNCVKSIIQDSIGYMWFATQDGLNRFNGVEFSNYGHSSTKDNNNYINVVSILNHIDNNHIWVASTEKLYLFNTKQETFTPFEKFTEKGVPVNSVFSMEYDNEGRLWLGTANGLFIYDEHKNKLKLYKQIPSNPNSIPDNHIWVVYKDLNGFMWIGTKGGLAKYNKKSDNFEVYIAEGTSFGRPVCNEILSLLQISNGSLWIGTWYGGLAQFDTKTKKFSYYFGEGDEQSIPRIRSLFQLTANTFYIGSDYGLYVFNSKTGKSIPTNDELSKESIYALSQDREGNIWFGTYFSGVSFLSAKHNNFEWYYNNGKPNSISGNVISQFCEDPNGNIWIATEDGGLNLFNPKTKDFKHYSIGNHDKDITNRNIHALLYDDGYLWIGTFSRGLYIMNTKTGDVKNYRHNSNDPSSIINDHIYSLYKKKDGTICIGTLSGFCTYNRNDNSFTSVPELNHKFIYDMVEDSYGNFWLASKRDGIWCYSAKDKKLRNYLNQPNNPKSLSSNWVIGAYIDSKKNLWFCTEGSGICRYDYNSDSFDNYSTNENLPNKIIYGILDDISGNLWLSSNNGLFRYEPENKRAQIYTIEDGLQSNQFNFRSSFRSKNGKFYFGGVNGFNSFHPSKLSINKIKPTTSISSVNIYSTTDKVRDIKRLSALSGKVTIPYETISFDILFESLSYVVPSKNKYAYKIDNVHDDWVFTDKQNVSFINLSPGNYIFRVKSSNNDGYWSEEPSVLELVILPPPWKTTSAKIIYTLIAIALIYFSIRYYYRRQRLIQTAKDKEIEQEKNQELYQAKINFFTQVAHEIKTPVSLIKAPLESIIKTGKWDTDVESNLNVISKNTNRLLELIKQLLDFKKIEKEGYTLSFSNVDITSLVEEITDRFRAILLAGIKINLDVPKEPILYYVDREAITKIMSNLLSNAMKHAKSSITISLNVDIDSLLISVKDDGCGVSEENYAKVFEPFYQEPTLKSGYGVGIGLSLVKLLVEKHNGQVYINSLYKTGCEVCVSIPKVKSGIPPQAEIIYSDENFDEVVYDNVGESYNHSLLIVEDTIDMREFLARNLESHYNVHTANNGLEAISYLENNSIDIIISDIVMPEMDGFNFLKSIRADNMLCHIPFILLSAQDSVTSKIEGLGYGADAYIEKPFSLDYIKATINSLLENRRMLYNYFSSVPGISYDQMSMNKSDIAWLEKVNEIITSNFTNENFTIDGLSKDLAISRSHLQRKLKGLIGIPPNDYIRLIRLKKAGELLLEGNYRVNEVCFIVGFNNPSYFARCFQKQFGILPKDYARQKASLV